jgi:3-oxoacyl-[acyl-carrier protein] reductase
MKRLEGKTAVITGGANGIGKVTAMTFAQQGAAVAIWDLNEEKAKEVCQQIGEAGGKAVFFKVNTADFAQVEKAAKETFEHLGRIDVLINNAGITRDASLKKMTSELWQQVIDVNLTGVFNCTKCVSPYMIENNFGRIINTSSVVGLYGNFGQTNYVAAKAGVIGMTKTWARELGRKGITVNAVAPGFIATEMIETVPQQVIDGLKSRTPLERLGQPEDIAHAYLYLASDEASYVSGTVLSVDGALTM